MTTRIDRLVFDPRLPWHDELPYEILRRRIGAEAGEVLGPESSGRAVMDAGFGLTTGRAERVAWDTLRLTPRRLGVDFFGYVLAQAEEGSMAADGIPPPLEALDVSDLLEVSVEALPRIVPAELVAGPTPQMVPVESVDLGIPKLDLGPIGLPDLAVSGTGRKL